MPSGEIIVLDNTTKNSVPSAVELQLESCDLKDLEQLRRQMISVTKIIDRITRNKYS
jgi:hypothetical protein